MYRAATITPPFTATAAREADRITRRLSAAEARSLLARIEREQRDEQVRELRGQIEEIRLQLYVTRLDPNHSETQVHALRGVLRRAQAMYAVVTGEQA